MRRRSTVLSAALMVIVMFGTDVLLGADTVLAATAAHTAPRQPEHALGTGGVGNSPLSPEEQVRQAGAKRRDHPRGEALNRLAEDGRHLAVTDASSPLLAEPPSTAAVIPVTWADCLNHTYDNGANAYWHKDKYNLCRRMLFTVTYREARGNVLTVIGNTTFVLEFKGTAVNGQKSMTFDMRMSAFQHFGETRKEWVMTVQLPCANADPARGSDCAEPTGNATVYRRTVGEWESLAGTEFTWTKNTVTTAVPADVYQQELRGFFEVGLYFTLEAPASVEVYTEPTEILRCDDATYVGGSKCVIPRVTSVLQLSASDLQHGESARFIRDAQTDITRTEPGIPGKKVPGVIGDRPLHRLYGAYDFKNEIKASRRKVRKTCRQSWGAKYTLSGTRECDEYPFATTYENTARVDADTVYDYAVRAISASHNRAAGNVYGAWLTADHILDNDPFFVRIIP
jgi:hypothetical protein